MLRLNRIMNRVKAINKVTVVRYTSHRSILDTFRGATEALWLYLVNIKMKRR